MCRVETMIDLLMIIIRWVAGLLPGDSLIARRKFLPIPIRADFGPFRKGCCPGNSPGVGWMTMRLDPVPLVRVPSPADVGVAIQLPSQHLLSLTAVRPPSMPRDGA
jgi:hypothetical protein